MDTPSYPTHPIALAHLITKVFSSYYEADAPTARGGARAFTSVPVRLAVDGDPRADQAIELAMLYLRQLHNGMPIDRIVTAVRTEWIADEQEHQRCIGIHLPLLNVAWWTVRERGAVLDESRMYRYRLWRPTGLASGGTCAFLMLNPSTADEHDDDNTIRKCVKYARRWGYARLVVVNLFAYRTKDPTVLKKVGDLATAVGPDNDAFVDELCNPGPWRADRIVAAWGGEGKYLGRDRIVLDRLQRFAYRTPPFFCLKFSTGNPAFPVHPLYQKDDLQPRLLFDP